MIFMDSKTENCRIEGNIEWHKRISFFEYLRRKLNGDKDVYWNLFKGEIKHIKEMRNNGKIQ